MLDVRARKNVARFVDPIARTVARVGISPASVTIFGLTAVIAGSILISIGHLAWGAAIMGLGALLDILDGVLARVTGSESMRGALLDSFTDRVGEVAVWTGLAFYLGERAEATLVLLSIVAVCGSLLTPYLRAKAESFGVAGTGGLLGRAERLLIFGLGIGLEGLGLSTLEPTLWILAVGTWLTVLHRFVRIWRRLAV
jgi:CDP-diacylglycerol--glycerol-3-phosphate 3-phosphatidyltransferase